MKKAFLVYLVLMLVAPLTALAQKHKFSNGLYWELSGGVLTISGNGPMEDYSSPWNGKGAVEKIVIENGVTSIGVCVFWEYEKPHHLKSVVIGNSVKSIGEDAFAHCSGLTSISIPNSVTSIGGDAFAHCSSLTSISIPNSVTSIGMYAFAYCSSLTSISIPNSVTSIGKYAFYDCSSLTTIHSLPFSVIEGGESEWSRISIPKKAVYKYISEHRNDERIRPLAQGIEGIDIITKYSSATASKNGAATYYIVTKDSRYGLVSAAGQEIVPTELERIEECGKGFLRFRVNGYWGVMNYAGKIIIPTDRGYTKIGDYVSFTKRFPYEMVGYKGECNNLGVQVSKIKTVATTASSTASPSTAKTSTSGTSSTSPAKSETDTKTQTIVVEHRHDPVPVQQWQACWACGGMGTMGCDNCGGSGTKYIGDRLHRCSRCNGGGIIPCNVCYGNKGQYTTVYR